VLLLFVTCTNWESLSNSAASLC